MTWICRKKVLFFCLKLFLSHICHRVILCFYNAIINKNNENVKIEFTYLIEKIKGNLKHEYISCEGLEDEES